MTINVEVHNYFIKLLKCILLQLPLPQKPENINWYQLYALSQEHNVLAMIFSALEKQSVRPPKELWNKWKSAYENNIALDTVQLFELDWLLEECKSQEIRIMPLKGCILKELYPETYFRSMGDLDFLIDPENILLHMAKWLNAVLNIYVICSFLLLKMLLIGILHLLLI